MSINTPKKSDNFLKAIIVILVLVIGYLLIFKKDNRDIEDQIRKKEDRITELLTEIENHGKKIDSLELSIIEYQRISEEFRKNDSIKKAELDKQMSITEKLREEQRIAKEEREQIEEKLNNFKENPPKHNLDDPYNLIFDTKKRIDNLK